ncbi:Tyrosine recombinase XerA [uncultured archaeon]|nr:Tyrosine recombinase XerA [uncultured archaeon]
MVERILLHKVDIEKRKKSVGEWDLCKEEKEKVLQFLDELELGRVNKGKKICHGRISKYIQCLNICLGFFKKNCKDLTIKDIENFERSISLGTLKTYKGTKYMTSTQVDLKRLLKVYLRWRLGKAKSLKLVDWLDTRDVKKTPSYLSEQEIEKLYRSCKSAKERFLVVVLFDSGARAGEFVNIRFEDIILPSGNDNYVKLTLKEEYSKTQGRTIALYWKHSLDAVKDYLEQRIREGIKSNEPVYTTSYECTGKFLNRLGMKVLNKSIHAHLFRHSSATYYASKLNRQQICYRYGWRFSSNMPDVYISRAGMQDKELDKQFSSTSIEEMKAVLEKQLLMNKLVSERQQEMENELNQRRSLDPLLTELLNMPGIKEMLSKMGGAKSTLLNH